MGSAGKGKRELAAAAAYCCRAIGLLRQTSLIHSEACVLHEAMEVNGEWMRVDVECGEVES